MIVKRIPIVPAYIACAEPQVVILKLQRPRLEKATIPDRIEPMSTDDILLSLVMIVRDEAANLKRCLTSVSDLADEMVVVDTGSTDDTAAIAQAMGARVQNHEWKDDFSEARNASLELARGRWVHLCPII